MMELTSAKGIPLDVLVRSPNGLSLLLSPPVRVFSPSRPREASLTTAPPPVDPEWERTYQLTKTHDAQRMSNDLRVNR